MKKVGQIAGVVVGIWLMVAPAVLGYAGSQAGDLHRVVGPVAASLALIAAWEATAGLRWANLALSVVLVGAPLFIHHSPGPGLVVVLSGTALGVATPFGGVRTRRIGGGWAALAGEPKETTPRSRT